MSGLDGFPIARLAHRKRNVPPHNRGEMASAGRAPMKRNADGRGQIERHIVQDTDQRLEPARRTAKHEKIADDILVVDQGTSPRASAARGSSGRSASMMDHNRAACSRAMAPRRRWLSGSAGSSP